MGRGMEPSIELGGGGAIWGLETLLIPPTSSIS
jgi:hypothetical protein